MNPRDVHEVSNVLLLDYPGPIIQVLLTRFFFSSARFYDESKHRPVIILFFLLQFILIEMIQVAVTRLGNTMAY
jgi:hypothetical protein